jgi:hypothetical protein
MLCYQITHTTERQTCPFKMIKTIKLILKATLQDERSAA